jgi:outer membrane protein TolC
MKNIPIILLLLLNYPLIFSQTVKAVTLEDCIQGAIESHPMQSTKGVLDQMLSTQNTILDKAALPSINWNAKARIQSENVSLAFDNPMFPNIELPLYSAQTSLDAEYVLYDGGVRKASKKVNEQFNVLQKEKIDNAIDEIKREILKQYMLILFYQQKEKVLQSNLLLIQENTKTLSAGLENGVVSKTDLQQIQVREKELHSAIQANRSDILSAKKVLSRLSGLPIEEGVEVEMPQTDPFTVDERIAEDKKRVFQLERNWLETQKEVMDSKYRPKAFVFATGGTGYPNPLNFFDDELSLFGMGGIGFSWNILDWGKKKEEKQLIRWRQDLLTKEEETLSERLNWYNDQITLNIEKNQALIQGEKEVIQLKKEIAQTQEKRLREGVILPLEYLTNLNEIIKSELNLSKYELEITKLKLEYQLLKGNL